MGLSSILVHYQERIATLHATASQLRFGQTIALLVMIVALVAILAIGFLAIARKSLPLGAALLPVPFVIYAGRLSKRRNRALLQTLRLSRCYEVGVDRLENRWQGKGRKGDEFAQGDRDYQYDLNVLGEGSLFELLCTCRTQIGRQRLAEYLLSAPPVEQILGRQEAVNELRTRRELCDRINGIGEFSFQEVHWGTISEWLEQPAATAHAGIRFLALMSCLSLGTIVLLGFSTAIAWAHVLPWIAVLLVMNSGLGLLYRDRVLRSLEAIRALSLELGILREGIGILQSQKFRSPLLTQLVESVAENQPLLELRRLERLANVMTERDKEWFYAFSRTLLIGTQTFLCMERWKARHGESLGRWAQALGEFEALLAISTYAYEHPDHTFPRFVSNETRFEAKGLGHPLLATDNCVVNDVRLNSENRFYIISGSNMAGKSTLLRTIGLNAVLAYAGAPVAAKELTLSRFSICASFGVQDSLLDGKSKFLAEIDRLRRALTLPAELRPVLFLIDEILGGTNSADRRKVVEAVIRALMQQGAVGGISTHDLALTELADSAEWRGTNAHMASRTESDPLAFDYLLKAGAATQSSALAIARMAGLEVGLPVPPAS